MSQQGLDFGAAIHGRSDWQTRDHHGYFQSREGATGDWRFCACGFDATTSGQAGRCTVLRSEGSTEWVPINAHDRITIAGRKFARRFWQN